MKTPGFKFGGIAALVAVAALAVGATFALWSDFDVYGSSAGAEYLTLDVNSTGTAGFEQTAMAPGVNREFDFVVASRAGQEIDAATLSLALQNLIGSEDGCRGNGETIDDGGACTTPGNGFSFGQFADDALINVNASAPTTDIANACNSTLHPRGQRVAPQSLRDFSALGNVDLLNGDTLAPGEGICVAMGLSLPVTADNASQGDGATWDFRYDLTQVAP